MVAHCGVGIPASRPRPCSFARSSQKSMPLPGTTINDLAVRVSQRRARRAPQPTARPGRLTPVGPRLRQRHLPAEPACADEYRGRPAALGIQDLQPLPVQRVESPCSASSRRWPRRTWRARPRHARPRRPQPPPRWAAPASVARDGRPGTQPRARRGDRGAAALGAVRRLDQQGAAHRARLHRRGPRGRGDAVPRRGGGHGRDLHRSGRPARWRRGRCDGHERHARAGAGACGAGAALRRRTARTRKPSAAPSRCWRCRATRGSRR